MSKQNDGGPAFPLEDYSCGMTLRDYFAAHVPAEVPSWYRTKFFKEHWKASAIRPRSMDEGLSVQNARLRGLINEWWRTYNQSHDVPYTLESLGESEQERSYLKNWEKEFVEYSENCADDMALHEENLYFAWRDYYADCMINQRLPRKS